MAVDGQKSRPKLAPEEQRRVGKKRKEWKRKNRKEKIEKKKTKRKKKCSGTAKVLAPPSPYALRTRVPNEYVCTSCTRPDLIFTRYLAQLEHLLALR